MMKKFWKPGAIAPGVEIERDNKAELDAEVIVYNPRRNLSLKQQRILLPIYGSRREILYALERYRTVIVVGETGSGKTTQIPQYLHEAGWTAGNRAVVCTQPRRIACTTVATRVAAEMNAELGEEVGYSIRFDDCSQPYRTKIKYVTDGMLIRECMSDPLLTRYSVVMVDEAHERSLATDIVLGLLRKILKKRSDLRVIISSATLDAKTFQKFFELNSKEVNDKKMEERKKATKPKKRSRWGPAIVPEPEKKDPATTRIVSIEGRVFPVQVMYAKQPVKNYVQAVVDTVLYLHTRRGGREEGDILVFLTGKQEIDQAYELLRNAPRDLLIMRLYGGMQGKDQQRVFRPAPRGCRKTVLSTNIAETSVTIDNIVYVVDCGYVKLPSYDPRTNISQLHVTPVSKAQAKQRAGRAGRMREGFCYRLYPEAAFNKLEARAIPEIQRTRLDSTVLQLKALGITDIMRFPYISPPPLLMLEDALELLFACGALDRHARLTRPVGEALAEIPLEPMQARMLVASEEYKCTEQALSIVAMVSVQSVFHMPRFNKQDAIRAHRGLSMREGDHLTLLNVYNSFLENGKDPEWCHENHLKYAPLKRANEIRRHLRRQLKARGMTIEELDENTDEAAVAIIKCILTGFFPNVAQLTNNGMYVTVRGGNRLGIASGSVLSGAGHRWVMYNEVVETAAGKQMREVTAIQPSWLTDVAPHYYKYTGVGTKDEEDKSQPKKAKVAYRRMF